MTEPPGTSAKADHQSPAPMAHGTATTARRSLDSLSAMLTTRDLSRVLVRYRSTTSTSDRALALSKLGAPHGLAVQADEQTAGRGQRGRQWRSSPGMGLYVSFLLRLGLRPAETATVTLAAGVAVRDALQPLLPIAVGLKWPNDVLVAEHGPHYGKKLAGVLFEVVSDQDAVSHAILGIGINLRPHPDPTLAAFATSLTALGGPDDGPLPVLAHLANALETALDRLTTDGVAETCAAWTEAALGIGESVEVRHPDHTDAGILLGLNADGALRLKTTAGEKNLYHGRIALPGAPRAPDL